LIALPHEGGGGGQEEEEGLRGHQSQASFTSSSIPKSYLPQTKDARAERIDDDDNDGYGGDGDDGLLSDDVVVVISGGGGFASKIGSLSSP